MRTYLHLEYQFIGYQIDDVLGAHNFSYLEAWSPIVLQGGDVRQMAFLCTKTLGNTIGTGNAPLVYQQGKDIRLGAGKETAAEKLVALVLLQA